MASNKHSANVGPELARVLPVLDRPWYRTPHLLRLNILLLVVTLSATGMGFDGSMMNGLQSLSTWTDYFHNPSSYLLGITNAVLNIGPVCNPSNTPYVEVFRGMLLILPWRDFRFSSADLSHGFPIDMGVASPFNVDAF